MRILPTIRQLAAECLARTISDRRHLHAYPELSFSEHKTAAFIKSRLDEMGILWEGLSGTGVVGKIEGGMPSDAVGKGNVEKAGLLMAAEDFAYYARAVPSCFYFLGTGNVEAHIDAPLHNPRFEIDESALEVSTGLMAYLALKQLGN